jgi:Protein of unknown function (DUF1769)
MDPPKVQRRHRKSRLSRPWKRDTHPSEGKVGVFMEVNESIDNEECEPVEHNMEETFESLTTLKGRPDTTSTSIHSIQHNLKRISSARNTQGSRKSPADDQVVILERHLRNAVILLLSYCLGVYLPVAIDLARRIAEYMIVAWITCRVIMLISSNTKRPSKLRILKDNKNLTGITTIVNSDRNTHLDDDNIDSESEDDDDKVRVNLTEYLSPPQPHPALECMYVIDTFNGTRIIPNSSDHFMLDNDLFVGRMLIMIRTPDVNDDSASKGTKENTNVFVPYFSTRKRRFEFQWQIRLKRKVRINS